MSGDWHKVGNVRGADGVGVPRGGARGDVLKKEGGADHATSWGKVSYADIEGKVPAAALPEISLEPFVVDSEAAMLNLPAVPGRQAIRTDIGATFVLAQEPASELENWIEMVSRSDVTSVNSKTGAVVLTKADLGLENVDNTADSDKPLATTTVPGLMPHTDKVKLDNATPSASASRLVQRDSSGRFSVQPPTSDPHPASKVYVDDEITRISGGASLGLGSSLGGPSFGSPSGKSRDVVVEGYPVGAPSYNGYDRTDFIHDPVWRVQESVLGLGYVSQRWTVLSQSAIGADYIIGFAWERIWDPGKESWANFECVAGDTGPQRVIGSWEAEAGQVRPVRFRATNWNYHDDNRAWWGRQGSRSWYMGYHKPGTTTGASNISTNSGDYVAVIGNTNDPGWGPGFIADAKSMTDGFEGVNMCQGSGKDHFFAVISPSPVTEGLLQIQARRYSGTASTSTWLVVKVEWDAPRLQPIRTFTSAPPAAPPPGLVIPDPGD